MKPSKNKLRRGGGKSVELTSVQDGIYAFVKSNNMRSPPRLSKLSPFETVVQLV